MAIELFVTRRLFRYEFVIRTRQSAAANSALLSDYLARQERPRGFYLTDPRLAGEVNGSMFALRPWEGMALGPAVPRIEGYFVPNDEGSDVVVSVGPSIASGWLWLPVIVFAGIAIVGFAFGQETGSTLAILPIALFGLLALPPFIHGEHAASVLSRVFAGTPPRHNERS